MLEWVAKHTDITLWMRFFITLLLLVMLWKALFSPSGGFDDGFKNVLILLVGTTVGYFFNTSKGSTDKQDEIFARVAPTPTLGTVTTVTTAKPPPPVVTTVTTEIEPTTTKADV